MSKLLSIVLGIIFLALLVVLVYVIARKERFDGSFLAYDKGNLGLRTFPKGSAMVYVNERMRSGMGLSQLYDLEEVPPLPIGNNAGTDQDCEAKQKVKCVDKYDVYLNYPPCAACQVPTAWGSMVSPGSGFTVTKNSTDPATSFYTGGSITFDPGPAGTGVTLNIDATVTFDLTNLKWQTVQGNTYANWSVLIGVSKNLDASKMRDTTNDPWKTWKNLDMKAQDDYIVPGSLMGLSGIIDSPSDNVPEYIITISTSIYVQEKTTFQLVGTSGRGSSDGQTTCSILINSATMRITV